MNDFTIPPGLIRGPSYSALPLAGEVNWGFDKTRIAGLREAAKKFAPVTIGVIDTGADRRHPMLAGNIKAGRNFTNSSDWFSDVNQHGTHTAGTIAAGTWDDPRIGAAPGFPLVIGKALSDQGSGAGDWIADAMQFCFDQGARILSMSLGSPSEDPSITRKCRDLDAQGCVIVAAGGNSGPNTPDTDWPGRSPYVLSVAALTEAMVRASFSNVGDKIDTAAPGVNIVSCKPGGGFQSMSGTSMATPFVAGVVGLATAVMIGNGVPVPNAAGWRSLLSFRSVDIGQPGDDRLTGPGWCSPELLLLAGTPDPKIVP